MKAIFLFVVVIRCTEIVSFDAAKWLDARSEIKKKKRIKNLFGSGCFWIGAFVQIRRFLAPKMKHLLERNEVILNIVNKYILQSLELLNVFSLK